MAAAKWRSAGVTLAFFCFAVSLAAALVNLMDVASETRDRPQENAAWATSQLVNELLRLDNDLQRPAAADVIRERLDVAWSRLEILRAGDLGALIAKEPRLEAARDRLVHGFEALDATLGPDVVMDQEAALGTIATLNDEARSLSVAVLHAEEARFRDYINNEHASLAVLAVSFVGLLASGSAMAAFLMLASRRAQQAADAAAATERLLRDAIEAVSDGFALYDPEDRLVLCNERYRTVYRESGQSLQIGAPFEAIIRSGVEKGQYPAAIGREDEWIAERIAHHRNPQGAIEQALPNDRWVRVEERRTRDGGTVGIRVDISELKERERELAKLEALRHAVVETAMDAVITIDADGQIVEFNAAAERTFGFAREAVMGRSLSAAIIPHRMRPMHENGMRRYLETGEERVLNRRVEVPALRADGSEVSVELSITPVEVGGQRYFTAYMRDITQRQAAERALRESEASLAAAQKLARLGSWSWRPRDNKLYWSKQIFEILGLDPDKALDQRGYLNHVADEDRTALRQALVRAMRSRAKSGNASFGLRHRVVRADGEVRHLQCQGEVAFSEDGRPEHVSGTLQDVTELRETEAALVRAKEEAEAANAAKSDFLATMSHEIRTPLNGVLGTLSLLAGMELGADTRRYVDLARQSGSALLDLLNDILDVSTIEAGRIELEPRPFSVKALIDSVLGLWRSQASARGLILHTRIADDVPQVAKGDDGRLRQMLMNLVNNAVKFTDSGEIRTIVEPSPEHEGWIRFRVEDTGIGIPIESHGRVFNAFERVRSGPRQRGTGSGLGLAITRRLAELMGGTVGFASAPGEGSSFWFEIPLPASVELPAVPDTADQTAPIVSADGRAPRVLVAEDNRTNQVVARAMLERLGCIVDVVADGVEALDAVQSRPYDCVLMDISMPELDGIGATERVRALDGARSRIPILAATAYASAEDAESFAAHGFDGTVTKPLSLETLRRALVPYLESGTTREGPMEEQSPTPARELDDAVLDSLRSQLGEASFASALTMALQDFERELQALADGCSRHDVDAVRRASHVLKSLAPMFGSTGFAEQATQIHEAARHGDPAEALAAGIAAAPAGRATLEALTCYRAERAPAADQAETPEA